MNISKAGLKNLIYWNWTLSWLFQSYCGVSFITIHYEKFTEKDLVLDTWWARLQNWSFLGKKRGRMESTTFIVESTYWLDLDILFPCCNVSKFQKCNHISMELILEYKSSSKRFPLILISDEAFLVDNNPHQNGNF